MAVSKILSKVLLSACLAMGLSTVASATYTPTTQERQQLSNAVEKTLLTDAIVRINLLMIVQGYAYEQLDDDIDIKKLPLGTIKLYNVELPSVQQCLVENLNKPSNYRKPLEAGLDSYFKKVDKAQFDKDLAYLTDPKRQEYFDYLNAYELFLVKYGKYLIVEDVEQSDEETIKQLPVDAQEQYKTFLTQSKTLYNFMDEDVDSLVKYDGDEPRPLAELMGLDFRNVPFEPAPKGTIIGAMSIYSQKLVDDCHLSYWQDLHSGKVPL